jgi:hypothetical protein
MSIIKVRASSWGSLFSCGFAWEGVHLLGMRSPSSPRALLGTAVHAGTAAFDAARVLGEPVSTFDAAEALIDTLRNPREEVNWRGSDLRQNDAERIALALHTEYCNVWSPKYEFKAVELATKPLVIDCGGGTLVELTGTLDRSRIIASSGLDRIGDVKTGRAAVSQGAAKTGPHRAQIGTYQLLYEHTTGLQTDDVSEVIGMKTGGKPEIATGTTTGAKQLMTGTEEYPGLIEIGAQMFRTGLFPPNPQAFTCSERYCSRWKTCKYHE